MRFFLMLMVIVSSGCLCAGANLLENPSFEIQQESGGVLPENWAVVKSGTLEKAHFMDNQTAFDGKYSVRLTNEKPELSGAQVIWMQSNLGPKLETIPIGTEIEFSVYARADKTASTCNVYLQAPTKAWQKTVTVQPGQWQRIQIIFKKEDVKLSGAYACLRLVGNGSICFDKAYLGIVADAPKEQEIVIGPASNRIANGSMELVDGKTGEVLNWSFASKEQEGKGFLDTTMADTGANSLCMESATEPKSIMYWTQHGIEQRLPDCPPGTEMLLSLRANTGSMPGVKFQFYIEMQKKGKFIGTFSSNPEGIYVGWDTKILKFKMPEEAPDNVYLVIRLLTLGKVWIDDVRLVRADTVVIPKSDAEIVANDFCRIVNLPPRQTYIVPQQPGKLQLEYHLPEPELTVILSEIDGKEVKRYKFENLPVRKTTTTEIVLPELPENAYELRYESGKDNQKLVENDLFRIRKPQVKGVAFTPDHRMTLDGKPFFPIAVVTPLLTVDALRVYSQSGINTVNIAGFSSDLPLTKYMYEYTSKYNMAVFNWNNYGEADVKEETLRANIIKENKAASGFANFIGWLADEGSWRAVSLSRYQLNYRLYFKYAPDYVAWQNHAPRLTGSSDTPRQSPEGVRRYSRQADVIGCDIYPVPYSSGHNNLPNHSISCVGDYTDLVSASAWGQKPVWMMLQAFGWSESWGNGKLNDKLPRPSREQLRFMAYNAITHGATGIVWYGDKKGITFDIYSKDWAGLADINHELNEVSQVWTIGTDFKMDSGYKDVRICARTANGQTIVIAVNESSENREVTLKLSGKFYRSPDGVEVKSDTFALPPLSVLILSSSPIIIEPTPVFKEEITDIPVKPGYNLKSVLIDAEWVAHPDFLKTPNKTVFGRQTFSLDKLPARATLRICGDDGWKIKVNGRIIGDGGGHGQVFEFNILPALKVGGNLVEFELSNIGGPTGIVYEIQAGEQRIASGADVEFSEDGRSNWVKTHVFGKPPIAPWGKPTAFYY